MVSMGNALNGYILFAAVALLVKYFVPSVSRALVDGAFLLVVIALLFLNLSVVLGERCDLTARPQIAGAVLKAVLFPWVFMVGGVVALLHIFPGWKQPFSNTFGYLAVLLPGVGARDKLLAVLPDNDLKKLVETNPNLLLNELHLDGFDAQLRTLAGREVDAAAGEELRRVILLKEIVAEFMWHVLSGSVALITSFNILMNTPCS